MAACSIAATPASSSSTSRGDVPAEAVYLLGCRRALTRLSLCWPHERSRAGGCGDVGPSTITGVLSRLIGGFRGHPSPGAMIERMSCRKSMAPAGTGQGHLGSDRNGQELLDGDAAWSGDFGLGDADAEHPLLQLRLHAVGVHAVGQLDTVVELAHAASAVP